MSEGGSPVTMVSVLVAGDLCPIGCNAPLLARGDTTALLGDLGEEFRRADLVIANLECSLTREATPAVKIGPNLGADPDCLRGIAAAGIDVVGLANNHVMDYGPAGLRTTIETCRRFGLEWVGAGENLAQARRILVREAGGWRIGILALAEQEELGIATPTSPGINPLDVRDFVRNVRAQRENCDHLIVLLHGGTEHYPYPRPDFMDTCRFLVEQGASAVICQHNHCVSCFEIYRGAPIVYGQGNFLFDYPSPYPGFHEGILVLLDVGKELGLRVVPYLQSDGRPGLRRMSGDEQPRFLAALDARCRTLADESQIAELWRRFCEEHKAHYLNMLHGRRTLLRRLAGRLKRLHYFDTPDVCRLRLHLIRCESHREALLTILAGEANSQVGPGRGRGAPANGH
jgi:poly-gamma-glutamate synthesis protein (capsule biosynthesis protein)